MWIVAYYTSYSALVSTAESPQTLVAAPASTDIPGKVVRVFIRIVWLESGITPSHHAHRKFHQVQTAKPKLCSNLRSWSVPRTSHELDGTHHCEKAFWLMLAPDAAEARLSVQGRAPRREYIFTLCESRNACCGCAQHGAMPGRPRPCRSQFDQVGRVLSSEAVHVWMTCSRSGRGRDVSMSMSLPTPPSPLLAVCRFRIEESIA